MPYIVRDLGPMTVVGSSGGAQFSSGTGHLDDASNISLFFTSSALSSAVLIQVSQFDPSDPLPQPGWAGSTLWYTISTAIANITTSGSQLAINNVAFRGLRLSITATSSGGGEIMAYVSKQITV